MTTSSATVEGQRMVRRRKGHSLWFPGTTPIGGTLRFWDDLRTLPVERRTRKPLNGLEASCGILQVSIQVSHTSSGFRRFGRGRLLCHTGICGEASNQMCVISISRFSERFTILMKYASTFDWMNAAWWTLTETRRLPVTADQTGENKVLRTSNIMCVPSRLSIYCIDSFHIRNWRVLQ